MYYAWYIFNGPMSHNKPASSPGGRPRVEKDVKQTLTDRMRNLLDVVPAGNLENTTVFFNLGHVPYEIRFSHEWMWRFLIEPIYNLTREPKF